MKPSAAIFLVAAASLMVPGESRAQAGASFFADDEIGWHNSVEPRSAEALIDPGGTVTWENRDLASPHSVVCRQDESNAPCPWTDERRLPEAKGFGDLTTIRSTSQVFAEVGTFVFRCGIHPNSMAGKIVVGTGEGAPSPSPTPLEIPPSTNEPPLFTEPPGSPPPSSPTSTVTAGDGPATAARGPIGLAAGLVVGVGVLHLIRIRRWLRS